MLALQMPLPLSAGSVPTMDNFLVAQTGDNALAWAHLKAWLDRPEPGPPLYLWGDAGSGKSHLLAAVAAARQAQGGRVRVLGQADEGPDDCDLTLIDGVDDLDAAQQHAAFREFVIASAQGTQVMAAGRAPPHALALREDLRTRLGWGVVLHVHTLDEAGVRQAVCDEAQRRGMVLDPAVLDWLRVRWSRNLNDLMALLDRLDHYSLARQRHITLALLRDLLYGN